MTSLIQLIWCGQPLLIPFMHFLNTFHTFIFLYWYEVDNTDIISESIQHNFRKVRICFWSTIHPMNDEMTSQKTSICLSQPCWLRRECRAWPTSTLDCAWVIYLIVCWLFTIEVSISRFYHVSSQSLNFPTFSSMMILWLYAKSRRST
jgi:hypothetical protein